MVGYAQCGRGLFRWMGCFAFFIVMLTYGLFPVQGLSQDQPQEQPAVEKDVLLNSAVPTPSLSRDRVSWQLFNDLKKAIERHDLSIAEKRAKVLLELPEDRWFGEGQSWRGLRHELIQQLNLLPAHLREISLKDANVRAERDLAPLLEKNDVRGLLKLARRYQGTPASQNALRQAALRCWDEGDFAGAALISARSLPLPAHATIDQLPLILHTAAARVRSGEPERARDLLLQHARLFHKDSPQEAESKIAGALASFDADPASAGKKGPAEFIFPAVYPRYTRAVLEDPSWNEFFDLAWRDHKAASDTPLPAAFPVIAKGKLLLRTYTSLVALDLLTGAPAWECRAMSDIPDPKRKRRSLENLGFRDLMSQDLMKFLVWNQVSGGCVTDEENAYFVADQYIPMPEIRQYAQPGNGGPRNQLMACRLKD